MSRVYFHSPHGEAELRGSERAYCGSLVSNLTAGFLRSVWGEDVKQLLSLVRPDHYLHKVDRHSTGWLAPWVDSFQTALTGVVSRDPLAWNGHPIDSFSLCLNTAMRYGSDPVKLAARIHGQCEIHCYVEGIDRWWLADLIQEGLDTQVFRKGIWYADGATVSDNPATMPGRKWSDQGWGDVQRLLRDRDDEPVVMSYSVCDQFPNRSYAAWEPPPMPEDWAPDWAQDEEGRAEWDRDHPDPAERAEYYDEHVGELWYELGEAEQWRLAMEGLRSTGGGLRIAPGEFGKYYFGHGLTLPDLLASDYEDRLAKAFEGDGDDD